jgi:SAM-dependent methyltransferase
MAQYTLGQDGAEEFERARLALLEEVHDPYTGRQFDAIGVSEGWRCLDVGAGAGSATRLLAARVGDTGSVVSLDLDVRLLEGLASDRVQVRRHDAVSDPLPQAAFDLVHARNLLMHLPARLDVLGRLLAAVRPGRWLAVCESDFNAIAVTPSSAAWRRAWTVFCDAAISGGWDPGYGTRLVGDLEVLDLADLQVEVIARLVRGDSMGARLFADTLLRLEERMLALGARDDAASTSTSMTATSTSGWVYLSLTRNPFHTFRFE